MDTYTCDACGDKGALSPKEAMEHSVILLAEDESGNMMCLPCFMQAKSKCICCFSEGDIHPDTSCKAEPWLCEECLALPYRIHMYSCYINGCMTPAEFAAEAQRELEMDAEEEENSYGSNPWRSGQY